MRQLQQDREHGHVDDHPQRADGAEQREPRGDDPPQPLVVEPDQELEHHRPVELAFALGPRGKFEGEFLDLHRRLRGSKNIEKDLEADPRKLGRGRAQVAAAHHEIAAHRIAEGHPGDLARKRVGKARGAHPIGPVPRRGARAFAKPRGIREVAFPRDQRREHAGQQRRIVLMVGVHHRHQWRGGRTHPLDRRRGQPAPPDPLDHADARVARGNRAGFVGGAVGAVVVDDHRLPRGAGQRRVEPFDQRAQVAALVVGRQDYRKFQRHRRSRTA